MKESMDEETIVYCLDSILDNLDCIDKRLNELREALPADAEFPARLGELAEQTEIAYTRVHNKMIGLPMPRI